jgi:hypothetical protein
MAIKNFHAKAQRKIKGRKVKAEGFAVSFHLGDFA